MPGTDRALPAATLAAQWSAIARGASEAVPEVEVALARAQAMARSAGGPLVVAGSLYLVGDVRARRVPGTISDTDVRPQHRP